MSKNTSRFFVLSTLTLLSALLGTQAHATTELDRRYSLETVGFIKASDNIDGLFADYVAAAFKDYFNRQSRFILQDLSKADALIGRSKLPYYKIIEDNEILSQVARTLRAQSIIRTKIHKEGPQYRFSLDWLHAPQMDLLASDSFVLQEPRDGRNFGLGDIKGELQQSLGRLISKVPFVATVTGRDQDSVTINIGNNANLKPGDTVFVGTLDDVKRHPLLKAIVDWRLTPTGKVEIESVDENIAFGKIIEEEPNRTIMRLQKVTRILPKPVEEISLVKERELVDMESPPRMGWLSGGFWTGGFSRQFSAQNASSGKTGSSLLLGGQAEGQIWFNRNMFADLGFAYGFGSYSQKDLVTAVESTASVSSSVTSFKLDFGYTFFASNDFFGPRGWLKLGYRSTKYDLPFSSTESLAPVSFTSIYLGIGGEMPLRGNWGALLNLEFGLFPSGSEGSNTSTSGSSTSQTISSASDILFFMGGYYRMSMRMSVRAGIEIRGNNADYTTTSNLMNLNQKTVTLAPSLVYYF